MLDIDWSLFLLFPVFLLSRSIDLIDELITWDSLNLFRENQLSNSSFTIMLCARDTS